MSNIKDIPATLQFRDEPTIDAPGGTSPGGSEFRAGELDLDSDEDIVLEHDDDAPKKKKGMPTWVIAFVVFMGITVFLGGGFVVYKAFDNKKKAQERDFMSARNMAVPQPAIGIPLDSDKSSIVEAHPAVQVGIQPTPATTMPQTSVPPNSNAPAIVQVAPVAASRVTPATETATPLVVVQPVMPQSAAQTSSVQPQPQAQNAESRINEKYEKERVQSQRSLQDLQARVQSLEVQIAKLNNGRPAPAAPPATAAPAQTKSVEHRATTPSKVAKRVERAQPASSTKDDVVSPPPAKEKIMSGATVTGVIGNRAFIVKRDEEGREVEKSVAPGDTYAGSKVLQVDSKAREVILENGSHITTGK